MQSQETEPSSAIPGGFGDTSAAPLVATLSDSTQPVLVWGVSAVARRSAGTQTDPDLILLWFNFLSNALWFVV